MVTPEDHLEWDSVQVAGRRVNYGVAGGGLPVVSFDALGAAEHATGTVVPERHSWLRADPDNFGEVLAYSVTVARAARPGAGPGSAGPRGMVAPEPPGTRRAMAPCT